MPTQITARAWVALLPIWIAVCWCGDAQALPAQPAYLELTQAVFDHTALQPEQQVVAAVVVNIKPGFHAQSHTPNDPNYIAFLAKVDDVPELSLRRILYPAGKDETYKEIDAKPLNIYTGKITLYLLFEVKKEAKPGPIKVAGSLSYQVCDDKQCYFPSSTPFSIDTSIAPAGTLVQVQHAELFKEFDPTAWADTSSTSAAPAAAPAVQEKGQTLFGGFVLKKDSFLLAFVAAFFAGIIFNAVPCVLPVLPLKAIGFYEVSQHNRAKSIAFGAAFSLGLIASFAALAVVIVVKKLVGWGEIYSNIYFNIAIVTILLVMAIGTFGFFTINLPTGVYNFTPRHDTYMGNFLFGILTAILSTPCTFGLFLGLLVWAVDQPPAIGVSLLMTVGAGMAFPYFILSAFPELARRFPRTGPWSELVKQLMSFLLLGSAIFFARRFIQPYTGADGFWWTLFGVAVVAGLFLLVRTFQLSSNVVAWGVSTAIAAALIGGTFYMVWQIVQQPYAWTPYSPKALESGRKSGRIVLVEFTATWCSTCQFLEVSTLHSPEVVAAVKKHDVEMLKADLTSKSAEGWPLLRQVNAVPAIPFTVVYAPNRQEPEHLAGIYHPQQLIEALQNAEKK